MRLIYKTIVFSLLLAGLTSCKKNWLDATASNQIEAQDQFKQTAGFKDALMGVYIGMTHPSLYARDMTWNLVDLLSRQHATLSGLALYADAQQFQYKSTRVVGKVDALWKQQYNTIANINIILEELEKNNKVLGTIDQSIIKGELLGLRAFLHFDLMRLYGDFNYANRPELANKLAIPYVTTLSKEITPQRTYRETFGLMHKDINEALALLTEDPIYANPARPAGYYAEANRTGFYNNRQQRMNYYAVKALQARVFLWEGGDENTAKAAQAAGEVIARGPARLLSDPALAATDRILSSEQLFSLNVTGFGNITGQFFNGESATNYDALLILRPTAEALFETATPEIGAADIRFNTLLASHSRGMVSVKLLQEPGNSFRNIMPLMKLPEMYYILAESSLDTDLAKSIGYLNTVRASRGILKEIPANANRATVEGELFKEYRKEYISEGQLFFFYKRTGVTTIPGVSSQVVANDIIYRLPFPDNEIEFGNRVQ